jgi:hypothetical protein
MSRAPIGSPSSRRSRNTRARTAPAAPAGGVPSHTISASSSTGTGWFARHSSTASSTRSRGAGTTTGSSELPVTRSGPNTPNCMPDTNPHGPA